MINQNILYIPLDQITRFALEINGLIDTSGEISRVALRWKEEPASKHIAGVVELGDTLGLGPSGLIAVGVRVPPPAPKDTISKAIL